MLNPIAPIGSKIIASQAVLVRRHDFEQSVLEIGPLRRVDLALEYGILNPLAEVLANTCYLGEPTSSFGRGGGDVVRHENKQRSPEKKLSISR